jgi:hypothetical protein
VLHPGGGDSSTAGQSGCGRTLLQQRLEHRFRTTWHGEPSRENHDRSGGRIHADRTHARSAEPDRLSIGVGIGSGTGACVNTDFGRDATSFTGRTGRFTCCEQVGSVVELFPAIIAATFENLSLAEVAELADAHV